MTLRSPLIFLALVAALGLGALVFPPAASAFWLNLASKSIAHAVALPQDAPARIVNSQRADQDLDKMGAFALPRINLARARAALARGEVRQARQVFLQQPPSDALAAFVAGQVSWQAQDREAAVDYWRFSGAIEFFMQQAQRAADVHDWQSAKYYATIAAGIQPDSAQAHYVLADAWSRLLPVGPRVYDELDRALALTSDGEFQSAILSRKGEVLSTEGKWDEAFAAFDRAQTAAPQDPRPRADYALALLESEPTAHAQAVQILRQVIQDSPWYVAAYAALAEDASRGGDTEKARAWLEAGLGQNHNDPRLLLPLGELYAKEGRVEEAHSALVLALENERCADDLKSIAGRLAELDSR